MQVLVVKHCCIPFEGVYNTPETGPFAVPDEMGRALVANGSCAAVDIDVSVIDAGELPSLECVTAPIYDVLIEAGIDTLEKLLDVSDSELIALKLIGPATAAKLKAEAAEFFE